MINSEEVRNTRETIDKLSLHQLRRFYHRGISEHMFNILPIKSKEKLKRAKVPPNSSYYRIFNGKKYKYNSFYDSKSFAENTKNDIKDRGKKARIVKMSEGYEVFER